MKRVFLFSILIVVTSFFSISNAQQTKDNSTSKGAIEFTETIHDFGTIAYDGNGSFKFKFKNSGYEPITLQNVRSSCGCTIPKWPHEPVNPGEEAEIEVTYNTKRVGSFTKTITVYANAEGSPFILKIKGTVEPKEE